MTPLGVVAWWELRRIPYNFIVVGVAAVSFAVFFAAITSSGVLQPGEDAVEPLALIALPVLMNILYTGGWLLEAPLRLFTPRLPRRFGPVLFALGLGFSLLAVVLPALYWGGYRLLQVVHLVS